MAFISNPEIETNAEWLIKAEYLSLVRLALLRDDFYETVQSSGISNMPRAFPLHISVLSSHRLYVRIWRQCRRRLCWLL